MKKLLIVFLVLLALVAGLFGWKGGHHAIFLADSMEEWLDSDNSDQSLTVQYQKPDFSAEDTGKLQPLVRQWSFTADTFRTEYHDAPILGVTAAGCTAYLRDGIVYMDTGRAYTLPDLSGVKSRARELATGLLLYGRVRKTGDSYEISMTRPELELHITVNADPGGRRIHVRAQTADKSVIQATLTENASQPHSIPQPVLDAMVRSKMEPPMSLTEPLNVLLPAFENLLPLQGDLSLTVECGILNVSDTAVLRLDSEKAELERNGTIVALPLPETFSSADPAALALVLLRSGSFTLDGSSAEVRLDLTPETTRELCTALVPRLADLSITYGDSQALLTLQDNALKSVTLTAAGEVPFLLTTIPVSFQGVLILP